MDADKQAVRRFIDELQAVVQIGNFLLPDRFCGIVMDGDILPPRHDRVKAHHAKNGFQLQRNLQIDALFHCAVLCDCAAVNAAVPCIDQDRRMPGYA